MTKKERVIAAIKCVEVDAVPSGYSLHFPAEAAHGEAGVQSHLDFFKATDTDILKIMNENLVPYFGKINTPADYKRLIPTMSMKNDFMVKQMDFTKSILDRCEPDGFTMGTLHGALASGLHPLEKMGIGYEAARELQTRILREDHGRTLSGMKRIADVMCELAQAYIKIGLDGVYYAALGAEARYLTDEEFEQWIKPLDLQIMQAIREAGGYCFLHICKDGLNMQRYADYAPYADVVNWGVYEAPLSMEDGCRLFPGKCVMGGLPNRHGVLVDGTHEEVKQAVRDVIAAHGRKGLILGADCTLATEQDLSKVRAAVEAARE